MVATLIAYGVTTLGMSVAVATFAVNFALSLIVTRIFADSPETQQDMGVRQQVPPSAVNAIPVVYGNAYMGGTFVDAVLSTDQKVMYYVLAISSISQNGQFSFDTSDMYYGDRKITFDGTNLTKVISLTDEAGNVDTKIANNLYIYLYTSNASGTITPINSAFLPSSGDVMGTTDIAVNQRWNSTNRQMNGLGFAIVRLHYNRDADTTQLQPITFKVAHTLNGTGVAKAGDVWYDYITNDVYGGAVDAAFVDSTCVTTLNAYSDATITYTPSGGGSPVTQARYRINGVLDAGQTVLSNLDRIMSSCDSWMTYNAALGQWSVVINKAESASYAFNDNNIIGEIRVSATDITSSINQIEARFPFKENRDQAAFVNLETSVGLLYPNEPVNKYSITYDLVNDSVQAQYLANRLLEQAREDLIVSFSTTYYGIQVDAGNVVSVTNADYGWSAKLFRVMKVNEASLPDGSLGAKLELNEYSAAVYDDQDVTQYAPVANSNLASPAYFSALSAPTVSATYPSASIPSFDVTVTVPTTGRVTFGTLYYTTTPATPTSYLVLNIANSPNNIPVVNGTAYTFANITLPAGTYYFAFTVGNETATSAKSANSSALVWNPVGMVGPVGPAGPSGATGDTGLSALTAYRSQSQTSAAPATPANTTGATAPAGWSLTAPSVTVGNVLWYSFGQYNSSAATVNGIPAGQTQWGVPTAASVFQDIKSDNWNGSNPPNFANPATYGTTGYYIQQSTGDVFFNNGLFRGNILSQGQFKLSGLGYTYGGSLSQNTVAYIDGSATIWGVYAKGADIFTTAVTGESYGGVGVQGSSTGGVGVGVGVYGFADTTGTALLAINNSASGYGFRLNGRMTIDNNLLVTNLNANYLQGNAASAFYILGGALGTPASGTLTNCTAPASIITSGTIATARLGSGSATSSTFLRGDNTWAVPSGGSATPAGSNTQIQYNNSGAFGATGNLTYTGTALNAFGVYINSGNGSHFTNIAIGANVLSVANVTFAQYNTGTGFEALKSNTTASGCTGFGYNALKENTFYSDNTAVGYRALINSTSYQNTAVGSNCSTGAMTGGYNTAMGAESLTVCTSGAYNAVFGYRAGYSLTTGQQNTGIGMYALYSNTTGTVNTAIGSESMRLNTTGGYNTALGFASLYNNTTGTNTVALGRAALYYNQTGTQNTAVGDGALSSNVSSNKNTAVGNDSLAATTVEFNTAIGSDSGDTNTTGTNNSFVGYQARGSSATTSNNITLGNGSITTLRCQVTSITALSDARDKTDVKPIESGLKFVKKLNPVSFTWNTRDGAKVGLPDMGFIAQELVEVQDQTQTIPNLVSDVNPDKLEAAYGAMFPILVKAVQELTAKVEALEKQLKG